MRVKHTVYVIANFLDRAKAACISLKLEWWKDLFPVVEKNA